MEPCDRKRNCYIAAVMCYIVFGLSMFAICVIFAMDTVNLNPNNHLDLMSSSLFGSQEGVKLGIKYSQSFTNGLIHMTFESLNFTVTNDESVNSLYFSMNDLPNNLYPIHKSPSDMVVYREHAKLDPYDSMSTYFDMNTKLQNQNFIVFVFSKEYPPGTKVLTRTVDIAYQIK